jgi:hypothetical protein
VSSGNLKAHVATRIGALCYAAWGMFHVDVAYDIYRLGQPLTGIAQGRMNQLAAYMLTLSLFVIGVGLVLNWRNSRVGFWLNLCVAAWADGVWVLVVVLPGYVGLARGLIPPAMFIAGAVATATAQRMLVGAQAIGVK